MLPGCHGVIFSENQCKKHRMSNIDKNPAEETHLQTSMLHFYQFSLPITMKVDIGF